RNSAPFSFGSELSDQEAVEVLDCATAPGQLSHSCAGQPHGYRQSEKAALRHRAREAALELEGGFARFARRAKAGDLPQGRGGDGAHGGEGRLDASVRSCVVVPLKADLAHQGIQLGSRGRWRRIREPAPNASHYFIRRQRLRA